MKKLLSFVIPCYRSESTIESVINEIVSTVSQRGHEYGYEIICVNDFSPDNVISVLKDLANGNPKIKVINLAKNMGKHSAVLAGYQYAEGDFIINIDDDGQCPVCEVWKLLDPIVRNEADWTTARYRKKKQSFIKNIGSSINFLMSSIMLNKPNSTRLENFNILSRFIVDEIIKYDKPYPYLEGLIYRVSARMAAVDMEERERGDDKNSGFTLKKSFSLWLNGFTAFSVKPLRISSILGAFCALIGFIFGLITVVNKIVHPAIPAGYSSLMSVLLFVGGMIMVMLGIVGEYVGRIYICLNNTPQYVIKETINTSNHKHIDKGSNS